MKNKFALFALVAATVFTLASCLKDDNDYTYTDDSVITSFSVSSVKQYVHLTSSKGTDSLAVRTVSTTGYKFYINQATNTIYNPDSLPYGVDAKKIVCTVSTGNTGSLYIRSLTSDSVGFFNPSDSTDFSSPREIQVVSNSGVAVRKYKAIVNVHKEPADSFFWKETADCAAFRELSDIRTAAAGGKVFLFGRYGETAAVYVGDGSSWRQATPDFNTPLSGSVCNSVVTKDGRVYIANAGSVISTADGDHWTVDGSNVGISRLVAASSTRLYGYNNDGKLMVSSDNGANWKADNIDDDYSLLPIGETTYTSFASRTNANTESLLLIGTPRNEADTTVTIWGKVDEAKYDDGTQPWTYYTITSDNHKQTPILTCLSAVTYGDDVLLLGKTAGGVATIYKSPDCGLTWTKDSLITLPDHFDSNESVSGQRTFALTVDADKFLWLVDGKSGKVWRGRINRLGWKKEQTEFYE